MVYHIIGCPEMQQDIWRANICPEDVMNLRITSTFWKDVLYSWSCYNYFTEKRIDNQIIWYNSQIRIDNKTVFWRELYINGLKFVHQLFENGQYKTPEKVYIQYKLTTLKYNSFKTAIPREWKKIFLETTRKCFLPSSPHNYDNSLIVYKNGLSSKSIQTPI